MENYIFDIDIDQIGCDGIVVDEELGEVSLYFIAPKSLLRGNFPDANHAEIRVDYPIAHPEAIYATASMSPTKEINGVFTDYDWNYISSTASEIEKLMKLAEREGYSYKNGRNIASGLSD